MQKKKYILTSKYLDFYNVQIHLSHIPTKNGTASWSGWTKIQQMYENVYPNLALVLSFKCTEVECKKGLMHIIFGYEPLAIHYVLHTPLF